MKRELRITGDGSHTFYVGELEEPYHSTHGAIRESEHVFILHGFRQACKSFIRVLEIGFGTGLNMLLTFRESVEMGIGVFYHAVEKYPLTPEEYSQLNYEKLLGYVPPDTLQKIHEAPWGEDVYLSDSFRFHKEHSDIKNMHPAGKFDLVYHDAFAPDKQPEMWTPHLLSRLYGMMNPGSIWVSYTSKGSVRRDLISCGFEVMKVAGPPGKKEMLRAIRR